jgi:hypothetical protein
VGAVGLRDGPSRAAQACVRLNTCFWAPCRAALAAAAATSDALREGKLLRDSSLSAPSAVAAPNPPLPERLPPASVELWLAPRAAASPSSASVAGAEKRAHWRVPATNLARRAH